MIKPETGKLYFCTSIHYYDCKLKKTVKDIMLKNSIILCIESKNCISSTKYYYNNKIIVVWDKGIIKYGNSQSKTW